MRFRSMLALHGAAPVAKNVNSFTTVNRRNEMSKENHRN